MSERVPGDALEVAARELMEEGILCVQRSHALLQPLRQVPRQQRLNDLLLERRHQARVLVIVVTVGVQMVKVRFPDRHPASKHQVARLPVLQFGGRLLHHLDAKDALNVLCSSMQHAAMAVGAVVMRAGSWHACHMGAINQSPLHYLIIIIRDLSLYILGLPSKEGDPQA